jgi:hypothetical protein
VPAAAVKRIGRAFIGMIRRKTYVDGVIKNLCNPCLRQAHGLLNALELNSCIWNAWCTGEIGRSQVEPQLAKAIYRVTIDVEIRKHR